MFAKTNCAKLLLATWLTTGLLTTLPLLPPIAAHAAPAPHLLAVQENWSEWAPIGTTGISWKYMREHQGNAQDYWSICFRNNTTHAIKLTYGFNTDPAKVQCSETVSLKPGESIVVGDYFPATDDTIHASIIAAPDPSPSL